MDDSSANSVTFGIVEDERIESQAMERFIVSSFPKAKVIWRREDGESGLLAVRRQQPDILIVDIEMPVINGLELCEILYHDNYEGVILINTAYSKFSYAKRAIALKVFDYIIKPIDNEELFETLNSCIREAARRKKEKMHQKDMEALTQGMGQYALSLLARTSLDWEQVERFFQVIGWPGGDHLQTYVVHLVSKTPFSTAEMLSFTEKQTWLQEYGFLTASDYADNSHLLILAQPRKLIQPYRWYTLIWLFTVSCIQCTANTIARISSVCEDAFTAARECRETGFVPEYISAEIWERIEIPGRTWRRMRKKDTEKYRNMLARYLRDRLTARTERMFAKIQEQYDSEQEVVFWELAQVCGEAFLEVWPSADIKTAAGTLFQENVNPKKWLDEFIRYCQELPQPESGDSFERVLQWMGESFAQEVSLVSAAEKLGLDTAYFSRLFKKKTGKNFSDVLTDIRMQHAEKLLKENPDYSLEELSLACGFSSKTYFSEGFKKWKGMTITQFLKTQKE